MYIIKINKNPELYYAYECMHQLSNILTNEMSPQHKGMVDVTVHIYIMWNMWHFMTSTAHYSINLFSAISGYKFSQ